MVYTLNHRLWWPCMLFLWKETAFKFRTLTTWRLKLSGCNEILQLPLKSASVELKVNLFYSSINCEQTMRCAEQRSRRFQHSGELGSQCVCPSSFNPVIPVRHKLESVGHSKWSPRNFSLSKIFCQIKVDRNVLVEKPVSFRNTFHLTAKSVWN